MSTDATIFQSILHAIRQLISNLVQDLGVVVDLLLLSLPNACRQQIKPMLRILSLAVTLPIWQLTFSYYYTLVATHSEILHLRISSKWSKFRDLLWIDFIQCPRKNDWRSLTCTHCRWLLGDYILGFINFIILCGNYSVPSYLFVTSARQRRLCGKLAVYEMIWA